jgi:hypothetical protein
VHSSLHFILTSIKVFDKPNVKTLLNYFVFLAAPPVKQKVQGKGNQKPHFWRHVFCTDYIICSPGDLLLDKRDTDKKVEPYIIKSFLGVQGAIFQKSPLAAGGKEKKEKFY